MLRSCLHRDMQGMAAADLQERSGVAEGDEAQCRGVGGLSCQRGCVILLTIEVVCRAGRTSVRWADVESCNAAGLPAHGQGQPGERDLGDAADLALPAQATRKAALCFQQLLLSS